MSLEVGVRNALHPVDLYLYVPPVRQRVGHLVYRLLVHLHAVDREAGAGVELFVANVALEVFCFLMLDQNLLIIELPVAVPDHGKGKASLTELLLRIKHLFIAHSPAPGFTLLLLFSAHTSVNNNSDTGAIS